jgi:chlorite dismutase
MSKRA